jgi:hypothetical protein
MAKNTKQIANQLQRKYFRDLFRTDPGVTPEAADRLTETCAKELAHIRVRLPMVVRRPAKAAPTASQPAAAPPVATQAAPFDPHAFSLIVVMRKGGKDALLAKLTDVTDVAQLKAIAKAQHVALDGDPQTRDAILEALVAGTERRIAHREAAAS